MCVCVCLYVSQWLSICARGHGGLAFVGDN